MSDTISEFTNFISNDPLMLALCIAIVVLIIVFILVLILGKKKDDEEELTENTGALLQSDISDANLKSTQEFEAVNDAVQTTLSSTKKIPVVTPPEEDATDKEAPIDIDAALKLKEEREKENPTEAVQTIPTPDMPVSEPITVATTETPEASQESAAASAPVEADPFGLNSEAAASAETPQEVPAAAPIEIPAAPEKAETPAAPAEVSPAPEIADGSLPGIPDSTVNNSDDTNGMFGNLVESLSEENKEQAIEVPSVTPETPAPEAPKEAPAVEVSATPEAPAESNIVTGSESNTSVPLAGSPVVKEEKKVNFEPGAKTPEIITGTESKFEEKKETPAEPEPTNEIQEAPGPAVLTPEDDVELPMLSTPQSDDKLNSLSGESFNI